MNETWQGITQLMGIGVENTADFWRRQRHRSSLQPVQPGRGVWSGLCARTCEIWFSFILILLAALLTLLVGLLIAASPEPWCGNPQSHTTCRICCRDNGSCGWSDLPQGRDLIANVVFGSSSSLLRVLRHYSWRRYLDRWVVFLDQVIGLFRVAGCGIFRIAWCSDHRETGDDTRAARLEGDERLNQQPGTCAAKPVVSRDTIGNALYWLIFLLFLVPVLDTLGYSRHYNQCKI